MTETIVISGGGTGLGRATAERLIEEGRHVTVVGRRPGPLAELAEAHPEGLLAVPADVATPEGAQSVADAVRDAGLTPSGVVAAAGGLTGRDGDTLADHRDAWQLGFESNVLSAVLLVEALRTPLLENAGRVVLLSSVAALRGSGSGPYGAMKAALHGWMYDLARELGASGGTANAIAPGFVPDTGFWEGRVTEDVVSSRVAGMLVKRPGTPREVASLIGWLLGEDGGWVTGQVLSVNGGAVLGR